MVFNLSNWNNKPIIYFLCIYTHQRLSNCYWINFQVDGGFTQWTSFGECSKTCGIGSKTRTRSCTNPSPKHGGEECEGMSKHNVKCRVKKCAGKHVNSEPFDKNYDFQNPELDPLLGLKLIKKSTESISLLSRF